MACCLYLLHGWLLTSKTRIWNNLVVVYGLSKDSPIEDHSLVAETLFLVRERPLRTCASAKHCCLNAWLTGTDIKKNTMNGKFFSIMNKVRMHEGVYFCTTCNIFVNHHLSNPDSQTLVVVQHIRTHRQLTWKSWGHPENNNISWFPHLLTNFTVNPLQNNLLQYPKTRMTR
jgi:hypothetical protein